MKGPLGCNWSRSSSFPMIFLMFDICHTATWSSFHTFAECYALPELSRKISVFEKSGSESLLYFTLLWRIPPVYCKGYYLESLPWKFTKGQSQGKKNHLKPETVALQDVYMHIQSPLMWLSISKSYITSWLHHLREMKG